MTRALNGRPPIRHNTRMFLRRPRQRPDLRFVLFTRQGCHLCDDAWAILTKAQQRHGFPLEVKDVDTSPDWVKEYGDCVPVVLVNDKVRFRGNVNPVLLDRLLNASP
jgi:glutaredoxin